MAITKYNNYNIKLHDDMVYVYESQMFCLVNVSFEGIEVTLPCYMQTSYNGIEIKGQWYTCLGICNDNMHPFVLDYYLHLYQNTTIEEFNEMCKENSPIKLPFDNRLGAQGHILYEINKDISDFVGNHKFNNIEIFYDPSRLSIINIIMEDSKYKDIDMYLEYIKDAKFYENNSKNII